MLSGFTGWHLLVLVLIVVLLFGAAKLPALAKSMGQSARLFKGEMKAMKDDDKPDQSAVDVTNTSQVANTSHVPDQGVSTPRSDTGTTT